MPGIIGVRFRDNGRAYRVDPQDFSLQVGERVIVESEIGREMGIVAQSRRPMLDSEKECIFPQVVRRADEADIAQSKANAKEEQEAFNVCRALIDEHGLEMFLVAAEYTFDERKLLFYFTAEGRIDFRDLVRDLASHFRIRIELRQIGVRDDAKMIGGMGICGRELCCSSWMESFAPVSIRMAKEQNISMNPTKVSGNCGRLLCCLNYENDNYKANRRLLPKQGSVIETSDGRAKVVQCDILGLRLTLLPQLADGSWGTAYTIPAEEVGWGELKRRKPDESDPAKPREGGRSGGCPRRKKEDYDLRNSTAVAVSDEPQKASETEDKPEAGGRERKKERRSRGGRRNRPSGGKDKDEGAKARPRQSKLRNSRRSTAKKDGAKERKPRYILPKKKNDKK